MICLERTRAFVSDAIGAFAIGIHTHRTVSDGVLEKGMPAWSRQLAPADLRQLVAYVGTLRGKNLPGKAPEGTELP